MSRRSSIHLLACAILVCNQNNGVSQIGTVDTNFTANVSDVYAMRIQPDGKILIGGAFSTVNGTPQTGIARIETNGALDSTFSANIVGTVWGLDVQDDGKVLAAGKFSSVNGVPRQNIARLKHDGTLDEDFTPGAASDFVFSVLSEPDSAVVIGGEFTNIDGITRRGIARLLGNGHLDPFFDPGSGAAAVRSIARQPDGRLVIGGVFTSFNDTPRNNVARLNTDGSLDLTFAPSPGPNAYVMSVALQADGKILIGGNFTTVDSASQVRIARLHPNGTLDTSFNVGAGATDLVGGFDVRSVAWRANGDVLMAGGFSKVDGNRRNGVAKLSATGSLDPDFIPRLPDGAQVLALAVQTDGDILVSAGGLYRLKNFPPTAGPATLNLSTYAGITIEGTVGGRYRIEYSSTLSPTSWTLLRTLVLPASPYLFIDTDSPANTKRFYRAIVAP